MSNVMYNTRQAFPIVQQPPTNGMSEPQAQQNAFVFEKVLIGLEYAPPSFNVREQIIGTGGANLQYIRNETGAVVTLRGRGSLFIDPVLGVESSEPMHLYIEHSHYEGLNSAKQLVNNLIETLQQEIVNLQQVTQQNGTPVQRSVTYTSRPHIIQQTQTTLSQLNVPPPMLAMPPPNINQQNNVLTQNSIQTAIVQQNVIHQQHSQTQQIVQNPSQNIIHQQFVQHNAVPIQVQQGNMVIQQQIPNLSIPPPSVPIKSDQIVQFQHPPPTILQPQPGTQLQTTNQQQPGTQIVLNHPQNIQYQYIQQPIQNQREGHIQGNQVTIHHVYQPQQQIQMQPGGIPQTQIIEQVTHQIRPAQQFQTVQPQQFITIQGNTAYMVPPPTITHQQQQNTHVQQQVVTANPNIIIQQPQSQLQPLQMQLTNGAITIQNIPQNTQTTQSQQNQIIASQPLSNDGRIESSYELIKNDGENNVNKLINQQQGGEGVDQNTVKEETKEEFEEEDNSDKQSNDKPEDFPTPEISELEQNTSIQRPQTIISQQQQQQRITINHPPPQQQQQHLPTSISLPLTHVPPPTISVPPPMSVQHFVGNALISTSTTPQQPQIIHTAANGQNFIMSNPNQWQSRPPPPIQQQICHQIHPIQQLPSNQLHSFQIQSSAPQNEITHALPQAVSIATLTAQPPPIYTQSATGHQVAMTINPQVQLQFQPQIIQQIPQTNGIEPTSIYSSQINSTPTSQINVGQKVQQPLLPVPPPPPPLPQVNHQLIPPNRRGQLHYPNSLASFQNHQKIQQQQQQQQQQFGEHMRHGQKRKSNSETDCQPIHHPRIGMGPIDQATSSQGRTDPRYKNIEYTSQPPPAMPSSSTSANIGGKGQDDNMNKFEEQHLPQQNQQHQQQQSIPQFNQEHRLQFMNTPLHGGVPTSGNNMQHNSRGVRFFYNSNHNQNYQMRQMSHQNIASDVDNYGHHMNYNGQPPPLMPSTGYRGDGPPSANVKGPRYRGQWK